MRISVVRFGHGDDSTLGHFSIDGERRCFTLEDEYRAVKVAGETRIPEGKYRVTLRTEGGFHVKYAERFRDIHKGMLWLRDVPNFEYILIHCGNTDDHSAGCLLVGQDPVVKPDGEFQVARSEHAYRMIYPPIAAALEGGEEVTLEIVERG